MTTMLILPLWKQILQACEQRMAKKTEEPGDLLTTVELLSLNAVAGLDQAYGMAVFEALQEVYPRMAFGSVFTALERMTWKGYLTGELGEPEPVRGGRARKYYQLTALGQKVLDSTNGVIEGSRQIRKRATPLVVAPAVPSRGKP